MNIVLCGMMGAGKTVVGKELADLSGRRLSDTDELISEKYGKISEIFEKYGEPYFRDLETETAKFIADEDGLIVSTGGGFIMRKENAEYLKRNGTIFFLRATKETLLKRLALDTSRPLLKDGAEKKLSELLPLRTPIYEAVADYIVDTDGKSTEEVAKEILALAENKK